MTTNIKRSNFLSYLNTTPSTTATYAKIGDGINSLKINMNPKVTQEQYISEDSARASVDSYQMEVPVSGKCKFGDAVFTYINTLFLSRATLADAETDMVNVWNFQTGGPTAAPAQKQPVVVAINDFGGDAGAPTSYSYTLHANGAPTTGTFNITTPAFT
jgi:hypothetical protein